MCQLLLSSSFISSHRSQFCAEVFGAEQFFPKPVLLVTSRWTFELRKMLSPFKS
uniref:Uncharacterized protein n=1 Tax=Anguilla anguilla TaxID=7936 RepID=A0A0E9R6N8_ANGAN